MNMNKPTLPFRMPLQDLNPPNTSVMNAKTQDLSKSAVSVDASQPTMPLAVEPPFAGSPSATGASHATLAAATAAAEPFITPTTVATTVLATAVKETMLKSGVKASLDKLRRTLLELLQGFADAWFHLNGAMEKLTKIGLLIPDGWYQLLGWLEERFGELELHLKCLEGDGTAVGGMLVTMADPATTFGTNTGDAEASLTWTTVSPAQHSAFAQTSVKAVASLDLRLFEKGCGVPLRMGAVLPADFKKMRHAMYDQKLAFMYALLHMRDAEAGGKQVGVYPTHEFHDLRHWLQEAKLESQSQLDTLNGNHHFGPN